MEVPMPTQLPDKLGAVESQITLVPSVRQSWLFVKVVTVPTRFHDWASAGVLARTTRQNATMASPTPLVKRRIGLLWCRKGSSRAAMFSPYPNVELRERQRPNRNAARDSKRGTRTGKVQTVHGKWQVRKTTVTGAVKLSLLALATAVCGAKADTRKLKAIKRASIETS